MQVDMEYYSIISYMHPIKYSNVLFTHFIHSISLSVSYSPLLHHLKCYLRNLRNQSSSSSYYQLLISIMMHWTLLMMIMEIYQINYELSSLHHMLSFFFFLLFLIYLSFNFYLMLLLISVYYLIYCLINYYFLHFIHLLSLSSSIYLIIQMLDVSLLFITHQLE